MDPQRALDSAEFALSRNDLDGAQEMLASYTNWRARGGFEPHGGDEFAAELRERACELGTLAIDDCELYFLD